jgi:hypothetical protein
MAATFSKGKVPHLLAHHRGVFAPSTARQIRNESLHAMKLQLLGTKAEEW